MSATMIRPHALLAPVLAPAGLGLVALLALFWPECEAAVRVWLASTAYGHCFLIVPMALYLAWDRKAALVGVPIRATPAFALLALPVAAVWLLADRLGIMEGRQLAAIGALEVFALTLLGWPMFRALLAPLAFLVFLVPSGAFITPWLQIVTTRIAVAGLNVLGIPNYVTDLTIEIPAGTFYVAEACAGLRFLIAAVAFGVFYALLNYRSPGRRVAFIAASIIVPIFANGLRAMGIVALGHILGSAEAAAADHIIYGWVFFSIVMLLLVAVGMPLREAPAGPRPGASMQTRPVAGRFIAATAAALVLVAMGPAIAAQLDRSVSPPALAALPALADPPGCTALGDPVTEPARRSRAYQCGPLQVLVTIEAFPARSKSDAVLRERRRLTGEAASDDSSAHPLRDIPAEAGPWLFVNTIEPFRMTTTTSWVNAAPAQGGLRGRLTQARNSVFGSDYAPVLITASVALPGRVSPDQETAIERLLARFVTAQGDLATKIAAGSRL